jgi:hypothetical protein
MSNNHVIIGLGGTGGGILLAFRKILWAEHRNLEPRSWDEQNQRWSQPVANLGYLYVDSNDKELNQSDGLWQSLGESLALDKADKLLIRDANMEAALNNLKQNPGISGWIGNPDLLKTMIQNSRGSQGANQIRRFGRYLFAQSARKFADRITESVRTVTENNVAEVTFHICCTLGCGTGSGSVVDAISQIRKLYPDGATHRIFLYCLVTDQHVLENVGFFYPNQFAALTELNALRQGAWKPHDVVAFTEKRLEGIRDNFQCCFLISPNNERGQVASKDEQQDMIAAYIYQKTIALQGKTPPSLHKAESFEDLKAHAAILKDRCTTFGSFGIKRFRIPEEEIREKLSYSFSQQAVLQSLFNNWSEHGYVKAPLNRDLPALVTDPANNGRWYLTDDHLQISKDFVLAGGKVWKSIPDEWKITLENKKESLLKFKGGTRKDRETWFNEMLAFAQALYDKNFRDRGVVNYYQDKRDAILDYSREIRKRIEMDLFDRWKSGDDSLTDTERILDALNKHLDQRKDKFEQRIIEAKNEDKRTTERIREVEAKWHGIGWLTDWLTGKPGQLLGTFTNILIDKYTAQTEAVACDFAKQLVQQVINQLNECRGNLIKVTGMFSRLAEEYEKEVKSRIAENEAVDFRAKEVRLVEPKQVQATIRALEVDPKVQEAQCKSGRDAIASLLGVAGEEHTFSSFAKKISLDNLSRNVFKSCDAAGAASHAALFKGPTELHRILGRNVVEKLHEDYGGVTEALKQNIQTVVQSSAAYMSFEAQETQPAVIYRREMPAMPRQVIVVFIPKAKDLEEFRQRLKDAFTGAFDDKDKVQVVDTDHNLNEILLISVAYWYELRFMRPLAALKERYEEFIKSGELQAVHQAHLENQRAPIKGMPAQGDINLLPALDYQGADVEDFLCYVLLGSAVSYVLPEENTRGISTLHFARRDGDGMAISDLKDLGSLDPLEASKKMSLETFESIKADIDQELRDSYQHVEKKKGLAEKLDALAKAKFVERGRKNTDPVFQSFRAKVEEAKRKVHEA